MSHLLYITGCDGTGKSTHAELLIQSLEQKQIRTVHVWLRFPFFLSLPLLAYARWRGFSWYEDYGGVRHGYWDFSGSPLLRLLLPWTCLADAAMFGLWKIHLPLLIGSVVVCERYVFDMLVDLALAFADPELHKRLPGRLYKRLLPAESKVVLLDLDVGLARQRRPDLNSDVRLDERLEMYRKIASHTKLPMVSSRPEIATVNSRIRKLLGLGGTATGHG